MKKTLIYGLSALAVTSAILMQIPVQAATMTTTTTTYPEKTVPTHKTIVSPAQKPATTKDKGVTTKKVTETKTTKTKATQKMPAAK